MDTKISTALHDSAQKNAIFRIIQRKCYSLVRLIVWLIGANPQQCITLIDWLIDWEQLVYE